MSVTATDHRHMALALRLAAQGRYTCKPNPCVGAVIAHGDEVVGTGWHARAGEPHAEVFALREAGERARGATAYVTLEPCAHFGRTPPCADALLAAGITRLVYASADPNPLVSGQGITRLRDAGVQVVAGLMRETADALIAGFLSRMQRHRPFVRVKSATSLDGRIALASGASAWITGEAARADVQHWRAAASVVLTGIGTVLADDPRLTARVDVPCVPPVRVVIDSHGRLPTTALVLDSQAPTWIATTQAGAEVLSARLPTATLLVTDCGADGRVGLPALMARLAERGANDVLVEAGGTLGGALLDADLVDEWLLYQNPCLLGDAGRPVFAGANPASMAARRQWRLLEQRIVGDDLRLRLAPVR